MRSKEEGCAEEDEEEQQQEELNEQEEERKESSKRNDDSIRNQVAPRSRGAFVGPWFRPGAAPTETMCVRIGRPRRLAAVIIQKKK